MPDIDPAALSRSDSIAPPIPNPLNISKVNGATGLSSSKTQKTTNAPQRIDLEPLYTNLKAVIGDNWGKYKEALSLFILGIFPINMYPSLANQHCLRQATWTKTSFLCRSTIMSAQTQIRYIYTISSSLQSTPMFYGMFRIKVLRPGFPRTTSPPCFRSLWPEMRPNSD